MNLNKLVTLVALYSGLPVAGCGNRPAYTSSDDPVRVCNPEKKYHQNFTDAIFRFNDGSTLNGSCLEVCITDNKTPQKRSDDSKKQFFARKSIDDLRDSLFARKSHQTHVMAVRQGLEVYRINDPTDTVPSGFRGVVIDHLQRQIYRVGHHENELVYSIPETVHHSTISTDGHPQLWVCTAVVESQDLKLTEANVLLEKISEYKLF